jgi:hypothetical protein
LLTDQEAFITNLGVNDGGLKSVNSQAWQMQLIESLSLNEDGLLTTMHPLAFAVKANN